MNNSQHPGEFDAVLRGNSPSIEAAALLSYHIRKCQLSPDP